MGETYGLSIDKKLLIAMLLISIALGGGFTLIYLDLKADFAALRNNYATLSAQFEELQDLLESSHFNQTLNLTAVQIYNQTKHSVVIITAGNKTGSGFVYDKGGHIVTNNHVADGSEDKITVTFLNGTIADATFIGGDVYSDLSVLKIDENSLPEEAQPLILGDSIQLLVGEPVYAIGNPFGLSGSFTSGIVSQVGRVIRLGDLGVPEPWGSYSIADVVQFDAAVNPGNSGGPLLNSLGWVIGVTFAIETADGVRGFIGIGYAIPSVLAKRVIPALIENGTYRHPYLGIGYDRNYVGGLLISSINASGPAEQADLRVNDIITEVDGLSVKRAEDLIIYLERYKSPNDVILLRVVRNGTLLEEPIELTLGERS